MAIRPRSPADVDHDRARAHVDLDLSGMTCASCAARIEKRLNRLDGVTATVNFATEKAAVDYDRTRVAPDELVAAVEAIGYGAMPPAPAGGTAGTRRTGTATRAVTPTTTSRATWPRCAAGSPSRPCSPSRSC